MELEIETAKVFEPLLDPARDKAAYGGRGSAKSHFFGGLLIEDALRFPGDAQEGLFAICGREIQKSLKQSAKRLLELKLKEFGLGEKDGFKVYQDRISTPMGGEIIFTGLQDHTSDSIKSFEGAHRFWGEEAQSLSSYSVGLVRPTIRWENTRLGLTSEMWWSWNPRRKSDPVDILFRQQTPPTGSKVVQANWRDNPWFPSVLEQERLDCLNNNPDEYQHIWEGGYFTVSKGAYYAQRLLQAKEEGRTAGRVAEDPLMSIRAYCDIGGTGAKADNFVMWIAQFIGREVRAVDHYEVQGQDFAAHLNWLRGEGYTPDRTKITLPHDGATQDKVIDISYQSAFESAGYEVDTIPNQGKGAAAQRIEQGRRVFPSIWFDSKKCAPGLEALGWYHEKTDENRNIGLGPEHDWSSHSADAFGLMCLCYENEKQTVRRPTEQQISVKRRRARTKAAGSGGWMG